MAKEITLRDYTQQIEDYLRNARIDEAIAHSSHILTEYPKNVAAYRNLGRALMRQQRYEEGGELFRRLLGAVPDDFSAHYQLSIVYEQAKQGDAALYHIERAFDQQPSNKQVNERLRALYKSFRNIQVDKIQLTAGAVAQQYYKGGNYPQAIDLLERTLQKMPDRVDLQLMLARTFWDSGKEMKAAEECIAILKTSPYVLEANRLMTEFWLAQERPSDAQRFLSRIEELDPYLAFEIATGKKVPAEQFTLKELDFAKYAASLTSQQQAPNWLDEIEFKEEDIPAAPSASDTSSNWLDKVDEAAKPPAPAKKKVTDSLEGLLPDDFDFPESAGTDDSVSDDEADDLESLLNMSGGTGLTDLLGEAANEDEDFMNALLSEEPSVPARTSTGLTGMLRNLGGEDAAEDEDDSWLQELSSGRFDTGELGQKSEDGDEFFSEMAETVHDTNEFNPSADIPSEDDPLAWLGGADDTEEHPEIPDTGELELPQAAKAYDPNDPMAWLNASGIDFDEEAEAPSFTLEDDPSEFVSAPKDSMAWLGGDDDALDERHMDTNEFNAVADTPQEEDPMAWLGSSGIELDESSDSFDTGELATGALPSADEVQADDSMSWLDDSDSGKSESQQSDEDVLAEMFDLAGLTGEVEAVGDAEEEDLFSEADWQDSMSAENDLMPDETPENEDLGLEWLNEAEEDPMAWMAEADDSDAAELVEEDPMAWLNEAGITIDEEEEAIAGGDADFDLFGEDADSTEVGDFDFLSEAADDAEFDFLSEETSADDFDFGDAELEEEAAPTGSGMTGMLNFLGSDKADELDASDWLGELEEEGAFEDDISWLNTLDGKETPEEEEMDSVSAFASDFADFDDKKSTSEWAIEQEAMGESGNDEFDWGSVAADEEAALDWTASTEEEAVSMSDESDFGDFEEEAEEASMDWMAELGDESDEADFGDFEEEAEPAAEGWLAELGDEAADADFGDFGDEDAEPAAEGWLAELGDETADADFGDFEEDAEPAAEGWLAELGDETADADFGDFEEDAEPAAEGWLAELGDETADADFGDFEEDADFGDFEELEAEEAAMDWMAELDEDGEDFGDFEEEAVASTGGWGDVGSSGFTDELEDEEASWGTVGQGFTDELAETDELEEAEAEPAAETWLSEVAPDTDYEEFHAEEEDDFVPEKSTFGMTGMLNSIRVTRDDDLEETLDEVDEPDWLGHVEEEVIQEAASPEPEPSYKPIPTSSIDSIDWGDLVEEEEDDLFPIEEESSQQESLPLAEQDFEEEIEQRDFVAEAANYDEGLESSHAVNAPDWLNAMVPGLDLDFEAEEDAALEGDYTERQVSLRERSISEEGRTGDFSWLSDIVEEESGMMDAVSAEEDYISPAPPPLPQRTKYTFSQPPVWAREAPVALSESSSTPDYLSDFDDFEEASDFGLEDDFDDDFSFEDDEFDN